VEIDVSRDFQRVTFGDGPTYIKGTEVIFNVPFSGDKEFFFVRSTTHDFSPPRAAVDGMMIRFSFRGAELISEQVRKNFDGELGSVKTYLGWQANDVKPFNDGLGSLASQWTSARCEKIQRAQAVVCSLGFPIKG